MSDLTRVKAELYDLARKSEQITNGLLAYNRQLELDAQMITQVAGGSSTGVDRNVAALLSAAAREAREAAEAAAIAGRACRDYADQI